MGKAKDKSLSLVGLGKKKRPGLTQEEQNLEREQAAELREQESEKARRRARLGGSARRPLLSGSERGTG